jgi:SAM-dependent methyltransferase
VIASVVGVVFSRSAGPGPEVSERGAGCHGGPYDPGVELHPLARQFASVADAYERGRPEYGPAVIGATAAELGIRPGNRVLDLAAGTGKLTRALVAYGFDVVAVEPQAPLRAVLADKAPAALVLDGVAEQIPVEDRSVAAVMIADGFIGLTARARWWRSAACWRGAAGWRC